MFLLLNDLKQKLIDPLTTYYPSDDLLEQMLLAQDNEIKESVQTVKKLREKYCR